MELCEGAVQDRAANADTAGSARCQETGERGQSPPGADTKREGEAAEDSDSEPPFLRSRRRLRRGRSSARGGAAPPTTPGALPLTSPALAPLATDCVAEWVAKVAVSSGLASWVTSWSAQPLPSLGPYPAARRGRGAPGASKFRSWSSDGRCGALHSPEAPQPSCKTQPERQRLPRLIAIDEQRLRQKVACTSTSR
ncbi:hypothetical protein Purlil1_14414 [Purpureocillium lilacinum]|uniref:Uncharacterized protein n=1 Tax=Purpureocillium lilacinum TaxID=33203 RepID=A0ABR0BBF6_PURLI|nr:hypothetical protein Purlil1_14414 [Purpureocillium lilacinum]